MHSSTQVKQLEKNCIESPKWIKQQMTKEFPELISRSGNSKNHEIKTQKNYQASHTKVGY